VIDAPAEFPTTVTLCTTRIVRVRMGGELPGAVSYLPPHTWPDVPHETRVGASTTIDTGELSMSITQTALIFADRQGITRLILTLDQTQLEPRLLIRLQIAGEQHFYGLGEGGSQFDRLGTVRRFWNFQANRGQGADIAMPLLLSNAGYGVFFDSAAMASLEPGDAPDGAWLEYQSGDRQLDLYFIGGDSLRQVLGDVAMLLGRATMPPRWALGYMQSSRHFTDAAEVRNLAAQFRAKRLPCDALIFLSTYGSAYHDNARWRSGDLGISQHPCLDGGCWKIFVWWISAGFEPDHGPHAGSGLSVPKS
jgi:alpha-glucosidase (family GH31 glycosyl hydrolase)